ncbi:MAG: PadR family transcriptional regulator [Candidatus Geothermincolales bacterium]
MVSRVELMVLGVLAEGELHGYQLYRCLVDRGYLRWAKASKVAVYKSLAKLEGEGYLESRLDREGNAPEKRVYRLTSRGRERLRDLVFMALAEDEPLRMEESLAIPFLGLLGKDEVLEALERRLSYLGSILGRLEREEELLRGLEGETGDLLREKELARYREEIRWLERLRDRWEGRGSSG